MAQGLDSPSLAPALCRDATGAAELVPASTTKAGSPAASPTLPPTDAKPMTVPPLRHMAPMVVPPLRGPAVIPPRRVVPGGVQPLSQGEHAAQLPAQLPAQLLPEQSAQPQTKAQPSDQLPEGLTLVVRPDPARTADSSQLAVIATTAKVLPETNARPARPPAPPPPPSHAKPKLPPRVPRVPRAPPPPSAPPARVPAPCSPVPVFPGFGPFPFFGCGPCAGAAGFPYGFAPAWPEKPPEKPPSICRRSLPEGIEGLLKEIQRIAARPGKPPCLEMLDLNACGIDDGAAAKLLEALTRSQVGVRRLWLSGNALGMRAAAALASYAWHTPEPLWELSLEDNGIEDHGVEELLRCLYNHPNHPPRLPAHSGGATGPGFALKLELRGNAVQDTSGLIKRIEGHGGPACVQIVVTEGNGPAPAPADPSKPLPYLWVFLPRFAEQRRKDRDRKQEKQQEKDREQDRLTLQLSMAKKTIDPLSGKRKKVTEKDRARGAWRQDSSSSPRSNQKSKRARSSSGSSSSSSSSS